PLTESTVTIANDDQSQITIGDVQSFEGIGVTTELEFTVTLVTAVDIPVTVDFATQSQSATANDDFNSAAGTLTFLGVAGEPQTVTVQVNPDNVNESPETFRVELSNLQSSSRAVSLADSFATGTIEDFPQLSLAGDVVVSETDAGSTIATVTLVLNQPRPEDITVTVQSSNGSATTGSDFTAVSQTLTIPAGSTFADLDVVILGDETVELDEQFTVTFSDPQTTGTVPQLIVEPLTATITISNDDVAVISLLSLDPIAEGAVGESQQVSLVVSVDRAVDTAFTVDFQSIADTATADVDFNAASGTLSFSGTAGEQQTITVTLVGDALVELDEIFHIALSNITTSNRSVQFAVDEFNQPITDAVATINNDDQATLSINDVSASEGRGVVTTFTFTVTLDAAVDSPVTVDFATRADTATADADYVTTTGTLNFAGTISEQQTLTVTVNPDALTEAPETFFVDLVNVQATGRPVTLADDMGTGTIADANGFIVTAASYGGGPVVRILNKETRELAHEFLAYDINFIGGVRLATADVNGDGVRDIITAAGPTGGPHIRVFDGGTAATLYSFFAYDIAFRGGVWVASGDVDGDGRSDIITGADSSGGPHVKVFSGATGAVLREFMAYDIGFTGGVRVASGDVNGNGFDDIITAAGPTGGPHVKVFDGQTGTVIQSYFAYGKDFRGGVSVTTADFNGDGLAEIVTAPGGDMRSEVRVFTALNETPSFSFLAYESSFTGGVTLSVADVNGDGVNDILTGTTYGHSRIRAFSGTDQGVVFDRCAFPIDHFGGGTIVGGDVTTIPGELLATGLASDL
ncbi:MAG: FG-GAP-like repeat-containing protein, partial [Planctomycetota bacterium]|nr:FG-GAP-like repeat-containing protein [Planctomycetota bacterium]